MRENIGLSFVGIAIGFVLSTTAATVLSSFLFGMTRHDGTVFLGGACVLRGLSAVAAYLPARPAASLDPLRALRHE
jgi:ABC-type antimicrobial peptide transport system permease subunit